MGDAGAGEDHLFQGAPLQLAGFCPKPLTGMREGTEGRTRVIEDYFGGHHSSESAREAVEAGGCVPRRVTWAGPGLQGAPPPLTRG